MDNQLEFEKLLQEQPSLAEGFSKAMEVLLQLYQENSQIAEGGDIRLNLEYLIQSIDDKLCRQINGIIHHPDFLNLESAWRGLEYLVKNTPVEKNIHIRVLNVSKQLLFKTIKKFKGSTWDQSPLFTLIYENEYGTAGGEPYGVILGDYYFNHHVMDLELLKGIAKIVSAAHCPFISSAHCSIANLESWKQLANPRDISAIFQTPEYQQWHKFRDIDESRYVALVLPRVIARLPYEPKNNPQVHFNFVESTYDAGHDTVVWMNAAYCMAINIAKAFSKYAWCARIRGIHSGGLVDSLPKYYFMSDRGIDSIRSCVEIVLTDELESQLSSQGFLPLCMCKNTSNAVFFGSQTVNRPRNYDNFDATANAQLSARLPYIFAICRFAHYLKCIIRDKLGSFRSRDEMQSWLSDWISNYVTSDPNANNEVKARYPLAEARVVVGDVEELRGFYDVKFYLRPHYQLEGLTTTLQFSARVPSIDS